MPYQVGEKAHGLGQVVTSIKPVQGHPGMSVVTFSDGTIRNIYTGLGSDAEKPGMDEKHQGAMLWDESMEGPPATEKEIEDMMNELRTKGY